MSTSTPQMAKTEITAAIDAIDLVDHHVHSSLANQPSLSAFGDFLTESDRPAAAGTSRFDSNTGFALRTHCAPILGLEPHSSIENYWSVRETLSPAELDQLLLGAAGVDRWMIDTGFRSDDLLDLETFAARVPTAQVDEVVRLETLLEEVALNGDASTLETRFGEALAEATSHAVAFKSVIAYRHGLDFDPSRPDPADVRQAADDWLRDLDAGTTPRVSHPVLLRMLLWAGVETSLPVQLHVGYGDPDLDLRRCDPLLLLDWIRQIEPLGTDIMLLHCYPFHRQAGHLAQVFPHVYLDVGLAVNFTGAASSAVISESLELAPFGKVLYSSDAWGPPELHLLGSILWRRGLSEVLSRRVNTGEWSTTDAIRVARLVGRENAERVYGVQHG